MRLTDLSPIHKSDRRVLTVLIAVMVLVVCSLYFSDMGSEDDEARQSAETQSAQLAEELPQQSDSTTLPQARELFDFDPNTADSTDLLQLGLSRWQVRNILRYRSRGGTYRRKEDFARLYGLTVKKYKELEPYIKISPDYQPAFTVVDVNEDYASAVRNVDRAEYYESDRPHRRKTAYDSLMMEESVEPRDTLRFPIKLRKGQTIDINVADTTQLKRVPGIGSYYASRISDYGQRLGGFVDLAQLDEINNFPPAAKQYFRIDSFRPRQIRINTQSIAEMRQHPYMNYYRARAIVEYRRLHGQIKSFDDLKLLPEFPQPVIDRLRPYFSFEE